MCALGLAGQGLNMTMEDAAELAWHVQQQGLTPEALRSFELERIPRVGVIVKKAQVMGRSLRIPVMCLHLCIACSRHYIGMQCWEVPTVPFWPFTKGQML